MNNNEILYLLDNSNKPLVFIDDLDNSYKELICSKRVINLVDILNNKTINELYNEYIYPIYSQKRIIHFYLDTSFDEFEKSLNACDKHAYGFNYYTEKILSHLNNNCYFIDLNYDNDYSALLTPTENQINKQSSETNDIKDDKFDIRQREAIEHLYGPCIVLAPAGSGKTSVLIEHIIELINKGIKPDKILAMTFTAKASEEMKTRLKSRLYDISNEVEVRTYHSLCHKYMANNLKLMPKSVEWKVLKFMSEIDAEIINANKYQIDSIIKKAINFDSLSELEQKLLSAYQKSLQKHGFYTFDILMISFIERLRKDKEFRNSIQMQYEFVLIDECQDNNRSMQFISKVIASPEDNLFWVGDDDQCIYTFTGSSIDNILNLSDEYPSIKSIFLEYNYRCAPAIVEAATNVIVSNNKRKLKIIKPSPKKEIDSNSVEYITFENTKKEVEFIVEYCKQNAANDNKIAILYRNKYYAQQIINGMSQNDIPFYIKDQFCLFDVKIIKIIHSYLVCLMNLGNYQNWKVMLINSIPYISNSQIDEIISSNEVIDEEHDIIDCQTIFDNINSIISSLDNTKMYLMQKWIEFETNFNIMRENVINLVSVNDRIEYIFSTLNLFQTIDDNERDAYDVYTNLATESKNEYELIQKIKNINIDSNKNEEDFDILLFTIHSSKGKQFDTVFLIGLEEGILPSKRSINEHGDEEERRVCYVGITRAIRKLYIVNANDKGLPSRFIEESKEPKMDCSICSVNVARRDFNLCIGCNEYFCSDHREKCHVCGQNICTNCADTCKCESLLCPDCINKTCAECQCDICPNQLVKCIKCDKNLCNEHLIKCEWCDQIFCINCYTAVSCKSCHLTYCPSCINDHNLCVACNNKELIDSKEITNLLESSNIIVKNPRVRIGIAQNYIIYYNKKFFGFYSKSIRIKRMIC